MAFGVCLANHVSTLMPAFGSSILEIGPGSGRLAVDVLTQLEKNGALPECYYFLELSAALAARQQAFVRERLPHLFNRCHWLSSWPTRRLSGVVFANELFDAMPVHQIRVNTPLSECFIEVDQGRLVTRFQPTSNQRLIEQWQSYALSLPIGYTTEINLHIHPWMHGLRQSLDRAYAIFIDYGYKREHYYHPDRSQGTLMCHYQHQANDNPLLHIGEQDITAHVDFTLIAEAAIECGFSVAGLSSQSHYLIQHGVTQWLGSIQEDEARLHLTQQLKPLIMPGQMGEAFKVIELVLEPVDHPSN